MLLKHILHNSKKEDATLPVILCLAVPGIVMAKARNMVRALYLQQNI